MTATQASQTSARVLPTRILLPADSAVPTAVVRVPDVGGQAPARRGAATAETWSDPYVSPLVHIRDERDANAWFHFCHGHHLEFLYWEATIVACERATAATLEHDEDLAREWVDRICTLIRGSAAMLSFCGAFDPEVYDPLLRDSMASSVTTSAATCPSTSCA